MSPDSFLLPVALVPCVRIITTTSALKKTFKHIKYGGVYLRYVKVNIAK